MGVFDDQEDLPGVDAPWQEQDEDSMATVNDDDAAVAAEPADDATFEPLSTGRRTAREVAEESWLNHQPRPEDIHGARQED